MGTVTLKHLWTTLSTLWLYTFNITFRELYLRTHNNNSKTNNNNDNNTIKILLNAHKNKCRYKISTVFTHKAAAKINKLRELLISYRVCFVSMPASHLNCVCNELTLHRYVVGYFNRFLNSTFQKVENAPFIYK